MFDILFRSTWILFVLVISTVSAFLSVKNNVEGGKWFFFLSLIGFIPTWAIVSRFSNNVVVDAMIYDLILVGTYTIGTLYFTHSFHKLEYSNLLGGLLILVGLFLFKHGLTTVAQ